MHLLTIFIKDSEKFWTGFILFSNSLIKIFFQAEIFEKGPTALLSFQFSVQSVFRGSCPSTMTGKWSLPQKPTCTDQSKSMSKERYTIVKSMEE